MRFKGLDLNLLIILKALLDEKSVSAAALKLNVTQPAISSSLKRLREYFKDELLIAKGKKMLLSSHAIQIQPELNILLKDIDIFISKTTYFSPETTTRRFTIAANDYFCSVVLVPVIAEALASAPGVKINILPITSSVCEGLSSGEIDLAFSPEGTVEGDFHCEALYREGLVILACEKNRCLKRASTLKDIADSGHVLVDLSGVKQKTMVQRKLRELGIDINDTINTSSFLVAAELTQNTNLITIVHKGLAHKLAKYLPLDFTDLPQEIRSLTEFNYCVFSQRARNNDDGLQWLLSKIREQVSNGA